MIELIVGGIVLLWMALVETKLSRANRIARANYDTLKEMLELMKAKADVQKVPPAEKKEPVSGEATETAREARALPREEVYRI